MADTPASLRRSRVQRRVTAAFTDQLPLKATAVFLAIILWFVVNAKEPQLELVPVRFTPLLDSSLVLREPVPPLQAIVAGSPKQLIKLNSNVADHSPADLGGCAGHRRARPAPGRRDAAGRRRSGRARRPAAERDAALRVDVRRGASA